MRVQLTKSMQGQKVPEISSKIIDLVNAEKCNAYDSIAALATSLGSALSALREVSGIDLTEEISQGLKDFMEATKNEV